MILAMAIFGQYFMNYKRRASATTSTMSSLPIGMKWMHYYAYLVFGRMCSALMLIVVQQRYARFTMCPHIYNSWYRCFLAYRRHCLSSYIYFSYTSMMWQGGGYLIYVLWLQCIGHADHKSSLLLFRVQLAALLSRYT